MDQVGQISWTDQSDLDTEGAIMNASPQDV